MQPVSASEPVAYFNSFFSKAMRVRGWHWWISMQPTSEARRLHGGPYSVLKNEGCLATTER